MSETKKTQELAKEIVKELLAAQSKLFQDEMKKMQDEMNKLKEELSKKVEDAIGSRKFDEGPSGHKDNDNASEVGGREEGQPKGVYSNMNFDYSQLIKDSRHHAPSINLSKPPHFEGTRYPDWAYKMKMHLIAANLWEVVDVGVIFPTKDREITPKEAHTFHQNAQAVAILVSSLAPDEFNKVNGREVAKDIWEVLKTTFEGDKSVRKGNIELLHGELEIFVFLEGESTQAMFDRMMSLVNRIRSIGSTEWDENKVARKILRTYGAKNNILASVIMERPDYDYMTPQEVLAKPSIMSALIKLQSTHIVIILVQWDTTRM